MFLAPEVCEAIEALVGKAEKGSLVTSAARLVALLEEHKLAYQQRIQSRHVVCHPRNRDGYGCSGNDVHSLLHGILAVGWNDACVKPLCVESSGDAEVERYNLKMVEDAGGLLAPVEVGGCRYATLSASHTNQVLRLISYGWHHEHIEDGECPDVTVGGRISGEQLGKVDPLFYKAAQEGIVWTVISSLVLTQYPILANILQEAGNTSGQLQRKEHELQLARRLHHECLNLKATMPPGSGVSYSDVRARVTRSRPGCSAALPHIFSFLMKFSRGAEAAALLETERCVKLCGGSSQRDLGASFWDSLGRDLKGGAPVLRLRHAMLRLALVGPDQVINTGDVKKMSSVAFKETALRCDDLMIDMRAYYEARLADEEQSKLQKLLFEFEMELVAIAFDKRHCSCWKNAASFEQAAQAFVDSVFQHVNVRITDKWERHRPKTEEPAASSGSRDGVAMRSYDLAGRLQSPADLVKEAGFAEGQHIVRKADKTYAQVVGFEKDHVILGVDGVLCKVEAGSFINGEWSKYTPKADPVEIDHCEHNAASHHEFKVQLVKSSIFCAMDGVHKEHEAVLKGVKVMVKPCKSVVAVAHFKKKQLVLEFSLLPWVALPRDDARGAVCPFFIVQLTQQQDDANMEMATQVNNGVAVPVMRNSTAICAGDELRLYRAKTEPVRELAPIHKIDEPAPKPS
ncbi:unnamed protein product, partial [Effrenium voratum]